MALNINSLSDTLSKSASSVKSTAQTSSSLIATSSKDSLVAVDGYNKSTVSVLTSMKNGVLDSLSATKNYLLNTKIADLGSLSDALASAAAVKNSAMNNIAQISAFVGQATSTVKGVEDSVINAASDTINTLNQSVNSTFSDVNGNLTQLSSGASVFTANNFITSVKTLIGSADLTFQSLEDKLSETALKSSILQYAAQLGLSSVIDSVYGSDSNNATLTTSLGNSLASAFASGNLQLIDTMIKNLGAVYVLNTLPNAITILLQNYTFDSTVTADKYPAQATALVATLTSLNANWDKSESVYWGSNLEVFQGISTKAKTVLSTLGDYNRRIAIATHYTNTAIVPKAKTLYPYLAVS